MKVRIIKTSEGYIPQIADGILWEGVGSDPLVTWSSEESMLRFCTHYTLWGAKKTLNRYLEKNTVGTKKLALFKKELENPNVVYEAEV